MTSRSLRHIAIIMDGNNRWARQRSLSGVAGHREGAERIRDVMAACQELGVEALTLFAFSSENWRRPAREVDALMSLFQVYLRQEGRQLRSKGVRLQVVGNRDRFSPALRKAIAKTEEQTRDGATTLVLAADYGGRWDILQATRTLAEAAAKGELDPTAIDETQFSQTLSLAGLPEPDLLIRTGGELRISNFLLWHCAYTELYFSDKLWPDFSAADLRAAAEDYHRRQRRFGCSGEQIAGGAGLA